VPHTESEIPRPSTGSTLGVAFQHTQQPVPPLARNSFIDANKAALVDDDPSRIGLVDFLSDAGTYCMSGNASEFEPDGGGRCWWTLFW